MNEVGYGDVPKFPGYRVGDDGSVWTSKRKGNWIVKDAGVWKRMKVKMHPRGDYFLVTLTHNGKYKTFLLHKLVLLVFAGPPPTKKHLALHRDDDKTNNAFSNLYWGTHQQNMDDAVRNGKTTKGETNGCSKLTEDQAKEVLRLRAEEGFGSRRIARMLGDGITPQAIQLILSGHRWKHLPRPKVMLKWLSQGSTIKGTRNPASKLKEGTDEKVRKLYSTGMYSQQEIADLFGVHQTRVSGIIRQRP